LCISCTRQSKPARVSSAGAKQLLSAERNSIGSSPRCQEEETTGQHLAGVNQVVNDFLSSALDFQRYRLQFDYSVCLMCWPMVLDAELVERKWAT
jgi:hypothetical protein